MTIGVLSIQGSFREHIDALLDMGINCVSVKSIEDINSIDALIIPGGESTTISKLLKKYSIEEAIIKRVDNGMPIYGTCAGMILLSNNISYSLNLMDIEVDRNAYGRQLDSFIDELEDIEKKDLGVKKIKACFIRAPRIKNTGEEVQTLARCEGVPVLVRQGNMLASSFHPELTDDRSVYRYFLKMVKALN